MSNNTFNDILYIIISILLKIDLIKTRSVKPLASMYNELNL